MLLRSALSSLLIALVFVFTVPVEAASEDETASISAAVPHDEFMKNQVGIEALGRAFLYSVYYERDLSSEISAGVGYSYGGKELGSAVPIYMNFYSGQTAGRFFITGGLLLSDPDKILTPSQREGGTGFYRFGLPTAGVGYEKRTLDDFVLRASGYAFLLVGPGMALPLPWIGLSAAKMF